MQRAKEDQRKDLGRSVVLSHGDSRQTDALGISSRLICPICNSEAPFYAMGCSRCGSTQIIGGKMMEHRVCYHVDFEEKFNALEGRVCPKCGGGDTHSGIDYFQLGPGYKCLSCSFFTKEPIMLFNCSSCGYSSAKDRKLPSNLKRFQPGPAGKGTNLEPIVRRVRSKGWFAVPFASLVGKSGVEHEFTLVFSEAPIKDRRVRTGRVMVAELISSTRQVSQIQLLTFFAKALDVGVKNRILVAIPNLDRDAKKFADSYGIIVLEASSAEGALELLAEKVRGTIENPPLYKDRRRLGSAAKRTSFDIIADVLTIAERPISKTEILYRANLSFKQSEKYLGMLEKMGLVRKYFEDGVNRRFVITEKGSEYLLNTLKHFGRVSEGSSSVWGSKKDDRLL